MEIRFPHQIYYEVPGEVPVADVVESLLGAERLLLDMGPLLERLVPDLEVRVRVFVSEVSQSSLREVLLTALFLTYQKDLEKEVPDLINNLFGVDLSSHSTIAKVIFALLLYYGAEYVYRLVNKTIEKSAIHEQLDKLIKDVASEFHLAEDTIRQVLNDRYGGGSPRVKLLSKAALRVFAPSKRQGNAALVIGDHRIEPTLVAQVPSDARILEAEEAPTTDPYENVRIELHAQDIDRAKTGWAAIVPEISANRLRMQIYPPLKPEDIYTKSTILGDIVLVSERSGSGELEPVMFYLVRVHESS